jgi:hypothetical protein
MEKTSWSGIPSLENLEIDWDYSPENPLGKRSWVRISNIDLYQLLDVEYIPIKIVSKTLNKTGQLIDISPNGLGVLVDRGMKEGVLVNVGFFLGKYKVTSRGLVENFMPFENHFRVGIRFIDLQKEHATFIVGINSSRVFNHKR